MALINQAATVNYQISLHSLASIAEGTFILFNFEVSGIPYSLPYCFHCHMTKCHSGQCLSLASVVCGFILSTLKRKIILAALQKASF